MIIKEIPVDEIKVKDNHRSNIQETNLNELMQSIKNNGLKQPIGVIEEKPGKFTLNYGHRRLLAVQKLGWPKIPALISKNISDRNFLINNLTENIQRAEPSFAEYGRMIEKLEKDKMTLDEISVRLGIPLKKIKQISRTYKSLPAKHRSKIKFMSKGENRDGAIGADLARHITNIKKHHGLTYDAVDQLFEAVEKKGLKVPDVNNVAMLMKSGVSLEASLKKIDDYHVFIVEIVAHKGLVQRLMQEKGIESQALLFKKIVYGEFPPIAKPDFIKLGK